MNLLNYYYKNIVVYDLLNKFQYTKNTQCPAFKKIVLNFNYSNFSTKQIIALLLFLDLIALKKGYLIFSKKPNIKLKLKKGYPVGCKVVLIKEKMFVFLSKLILQTIPKLNLVENILNLKDKKMDNFSFKIKTILNFSEIEPHYKFFKKLPELNVSLCTNFLNYKECMFFFKSFKVILQI